MIEAEQLASPALLFVLAILALGFVRFGVWWSILRMLLAPILRPVVFLLLVGAAAAATAMHLGG